ncbi:MAG: hypothetical protein JJ899_17070 [Alphaproteobacteria bacterium]|nr:hypothetical protein [Alphaproteobacteria bacterium]
MTRVAPFAQQQLTMFHALQTQQRMYDANIQLATGQKAQTYSGIAKDASRLLSTEAARMRAEQYIQSIQTAERRIGLIDSNLEGIENIARELRSSLETATNGPGSNHIDTRQYAINARALLIEHLNAQDGNRYLFSGDRVDRPAVSLGSATYTPVRLIEADATTVDDTFYAQYRADVLGAAGYPQGSFYEQVYFDKNGVAPTAPLPADLANPTLDEFVAEDPDLWTYYVSRLDSSQMLATPKNDYYQGDSGGSSIRISERTSVTYGINADETSIQQLLIGLDAVANLPETAPADAYLGEVFDRVRVMLGNVIDPDPTTSSESITELRSRVLGPLNLLSTSRENHVRFINYAADVEGEVEGIDEAEVISRLQSDQVVLQASYQTLSQIQGLSLINFLR